MMEKSKKTEITEVIYNFHQISNHFKLSERNRRVLSMKYQDQSKTLREWEKLLKQDKFI